MSIHQLLAQVSTGEIANIDHIAGISAMRVDGGPGDGMRAYDIRCAGGFSFRILPDRGFDIGWAWAYGWPVSWTGKVGEVGPAPTAHDPAWIKRFGGGLLTTCGIDNVGLPSEEIGQHGSFTFLRATGVHVRREFRDRADGSRDLAIVASAVLDDVDALSRHLRIHRTITTLVGRAELVLEDTVENLGHRTEPAPILYHVNFGSPFWSPGATLTMNPQSQITPRDDHAVVGLEHWGRAPAVVPNEREWVFEHRFPPETARPSAHIVSLSTGLQATMSWTGDTLPRVHQWVHPGAGVGALGVEPANASVLGRAYDRAEGRLAVLEPGEKRTTGFDLRIEA
jgi:Domain of unknown function (DUF4432)